MKNSCVYDLITVSSGGYIVELGEGGASIQNEYSSIH